jgi:replicative DNA helicase
MSHDAAINAERSIIGGVLRDPKILAIVAGQVKVDDFGNQRHKDLWRLMLDLESMNTGSADPVTVSNAIEERSLEDRCGDRRQLISLMESVPSNAFLENHIEIVLRGSRRRRLSHLLERSQRALAEESFEVDTICRSLDVELVELLAREDKQGIVLASVADEGYRKRVASRVDEGKPKGIVPTPLYGINDKLKGGGFGPGQLVVIAARPSMGKTAFAVDLADAASVNGPTLLFSLEMVKDEVLQRWYAREAGEAGMAIGGAYGPAVVSILERTQAASDKLRTRKLYICEDFNVDLARIRADCLVLQRKTGLSLVVIDYLQLITATKAGRSGNREQEVSAMSRGLKNLAKELGCPVIILAQLNRSVEKRDDKRPRLDDLRESGAIEQDADVVLMLYRPSWYDEESKDSDEIIVRKNRHGDKGTVYACFNGPQMRWRSRASDSFAKGPRLLDDAQHKHVNSNPL